MLTTEKDLLRFWSKVEKTNTCWLWRGTIRNKFGYGGFKYKGKMYGPHIISYQLHNDDYDKNKDVCHKCDNPICINPNCLFLGTRSDNMKDCVAKGRHRINAEYLKGEAIAQSKLTEQNVKDIKSRLQNGERICDIARIYNFVHRTAIERIKIGKSWKHITI